MDNYESQGPAEAIEELKRIYTDLPPRDREFAESLAEFYARRRTLSPKQLDAAWLLVRRVNTATSVKRQGVTSMLPHDCRDLVALLRGASENAGRKRLNFTVKGHPVSLVMLGPESNHEGHIEISDGQGTNYGYLSPDSEWLPSPVLSAKAQAVAPVLHRLLAKLVEDPLAVVISAGRDSGQCALCGRDLYDPDSRAAGIHGFDTEEWRLLEWSRQASGSAQEWSYGYGEREERKWFDALVSTGREA